MGSFNERLRREKREELALRALSEEDNSTVVACGDMTHDEDPLKFNMQMDDSDVLYELSEHHEAVLHLLEGYKAESEDVQRFFDATVKAIQDAEDKIDGFVGDEEEEDDHGDYPEDFMRRHYYSSMEGETEEFATCSAARKRVAKAKRSLRRAIRAYRRCTGGVIVVRDTMPVPPPPPPPPPPMP